MGRMNQGREGMIQCCSGRGNDDTAMAAPGSVQSGGSRHIRQCGAQGSCFRGTRVIRKVSCALIIIYFSF